MQIVKNPQIYSDSSLWLIDPEFQIYAKIIESRSDPPENYIQIIS